MKKLSLLTLFILFFSSVYPQIWEDNLRGKIINPTNKERSESFDRYRLIHPYTKGNGYKPYAREIEFVTKRISGDAVFPKNALYIEWKKEKEKYEHFKFSTSFEEY